MSANNNDDEEDDKNDEDFVVNIKQEVMEEEEEEEKVEEVAREVEAVEEVVEEKKEDVNENFIYNDMLARALVQLFPREERTLIHMWLEKLRSTSVDDIEKLSNRNNYMWLLLSTLQNGSLVEPFDEVPPVEGLPPICDIMPAQMIEEMISSPDKTFSQTDATSSNASVMDLKEPESVAMPPHKFLEHQPRPVDGISCYFSVFSRPT